MLYRVYFFPVSIIGHCWRQDIALGEQIIWYNKKNMVCVYLTY